MTPPSRRIVLVGGGHAHLEAARLLGRGRASGLEVVIIDPGRFWYSGRAPGMLSGMYTAEEDTIDLRRAAEASGGRFVEDRVVRLDQSRKRLGLASGGEVAYGAVSFNVGSVVDLDGVEGAAGHGWPVKPIAGLWELRRHLLETFGRRRPGPPAVWVVGGGPTGCEIAANVAGLAERRGITARVGILSGSRRLLPGLPAGASRRLHARLVERGVTVRCSGEESGLRVVGVEAGAVHLSRGGGGERIPSDVTILATGLRAAPLVSRLGLPAHGKGGLITDTSLRSTGDPAVFGAGDCIHFRGRGLPNLGVYGVRQAPVLARNLVAAVSGGPPVRYDPQRHALAVLNLGDGTALAVRGRWWWMGRASMWLKDLLDRRFMDRHRG